MLPKKKQKKLNIYFISIQTVNPVVYIIQNMQIYSSGKVGCLRTSNESNLGSM